MLGGWARGQVPAGRRLPPPRETHADVPPSAPPPALPRSPAGTYQSDNTCAICPTGTFRAGPAGAGNNACKKIPAGSHATFVAASKYNLQQFTLPSGTSAPAKLKTGVVLCPKGTEAYYVGGVRRPNTDDACRPCAANTYAATAGTLKCKPCAAGTITKPLKAGAKFGAASCVRRTLTTRIH